MTKVYDAMPNREILAITARMPPDTKHIIKMPTFDFIFLGEVVAFSLEVDDNLRSSLDTLGLGDLISAQSGKIHKRPSYGCFTVKHDAKFFKIPFAVFNGVIWALKGNR